MLGKGGEEEVDVTTVGMTMYMAVGHNGGFLTLTFFPLQFKIVVAMCARVVA